MRSISPFEHSARLAVLQYVAPAVVRGVRLASGLAETRMRRSFAAEAHVRGAGIEIGAAATPALVPLGCRVKYVDKYPGSVLRADAELSGLTVRDPDVVDSAETLSTFADDSQDFVLAFSLLEHVQDALGAIRSFVRVTRSGGTVVVTVPDKRYYGPDRGRPLTTFEHFERDFREGPEGSKADHFREVGRIRRKLEGDALERFVAEQTYNDAHTHFHVWDAESFVDFLLRGKRLLGLDYELKEFASYGHEVLVVLKVHK
jgi:SAM-dependent methyltransferase